MKTTDTHPCNPPISKEKQTFTPIFTIGVIVITSISVYIIQFYEVMVKVDYRYLFYTSA